MFNPEIAIQVLLVLGVLAAAYLSLVWPQLKRRTEHRGFLASLKVGDRVVTAGGLIGKIVKCDGGTSVQIEFSDSIRIEVLRNSIDSYFER